MTAQPASPEEFRAAVIAAKGTAPIEALAERFGISRNTVQEIFSRAGLTKKRPPQFYINRRRIALTDAFWAGKSAKQAADEFGVEVRTVETCWGNWGLSRSLRRPAPEPVAKPAPRPTPSHVGQHRLHPGVSPPRLKCIAEAYSS